MGIGRDALRLTDYHARTLAWLELPRREWMRSGFKGSRREGCGISMLQILGKAGSINVRKVLWVCHELSVPYEIQPWGSGQQPTDSPAFRALNPNALVPVIQDRDFVLWESNAICRWNRHMSMLDERLQKTGAFVAGEQFTLADIVLGLATNRWLLTPLERPALPAVSEYYERLSERPGFRAHGGNGIP
jgi:glutathione S-transferase